MRTNARMGRRTTAALFAAVILAVSSWAPIASGGETDRFGFAPSDNKLSSFRFPLRPGVAVRDSTRVFNKTEERISLRIYGADVAESPDGALSVAPFGAPKKAAGAWIKPDESRVTLGPFASRRVEFAMVVPHSASADGAVAAIVAEEVVPGGEPTGLDLVTRVAIVVRDSDRPGDAPAALSLDDVHLQVPLQLFPSRGLVNATVTNGTAGQMRLTPRVEVRSLTGKIFSLPQNEVTLSPGEKRRLSVRWDSVPRWGGFMRASATVSSGDGEVSATSARIFVLPLWLIALVIGFEAWHLIWRRRRGKQAAS